MSAGTSVVSVMGVGDDLVVVEREGASFQFDAYAGARLLLQADGGREELLLDCRVLDSGTWAIAPTLPSTAHSLPDWDVVLEEGSEVSPRLVVHGPEELELMAV